MSILVLVLFWPILYFGTWIMKASCLISVYYLKLVGLLLLCLFSFTHQLAFCVVHSLYMKTDEDRWPFMCVSKWSPGTTWTVRKTRAKNGENAFLLHMYIYKEQKKIPLVQNTVIIQNRSFAFFPSLHTVLPRSFCWQHATQHRVSRH